MLLNNEVLPFSAARFMLEQRYGQITEHPLGARTVPPGGVRAELIDEAEQGHSFGGWPAMDVIRQYNIDQALQGRRFVSPAPEGSASIPPVRWVPGRWGRWKLVPW